MYDLLKQQLSIYFCSFHLLFALDIVQYISYIKIKKHIQMKTSKVGAAFLAKFSSYLSKFKQTSTINVAHEQIRKLFSEYRFSEIAIAFATKMDTCDQLSDKQKKQYIKIYITLIDVYAQDVVLEHYDRIIDSIAKKTFGVSDVIGHLCRSLLKRIYPTENIANYIKHLLMVFHKHVEIGKIMKQIVESFDPQIIAPFQQEIISLISQKMSLNQKNPIRIQFLQAVLSMVLALESKFYEQQSVQNITIKNFKNQDWNVRKLCVDITYALLVIHSQVNKSLHQNVLELKYDKIKHVRDSVGNYTNLYKQIYGEEKQKQKERPSIPSSKAVTQRKNIINTQEKRPLVNKSPAIPTKMRNNEQEHKSNPKSLQKSIRNTVRNEGFFQNAGTRDVIKLPQSKSFVQLESNQKQKRTERVSQNNIMQKENFQIEQPNQENPVIQNENEVNFEQYLKNRPKHDNYFNFSPTQPHQKPISRAQEKIQTGSNPLQKNRNFGSPKNNRKKEFKQTVGNKKQLHEQNITQSKVQGQLTPNQIASNNLLRKQLQLVQLKLEKFKLEVLSRLSSIENRVQILQQKKMKDESIDQISLSSLQKQIKQIKSHTNQNNYFQESFEQKFNNSNVNEDKNGKFTKKQHAFQTEIKKQIHNPNFQTFSVPIQSNLNQKIKDSIVQGNWNEAFSLAIANNSRDSIMQLLEYNKVPQEKVVLDCLFVELRKNLNNLAVLKWLVNFIEYNEIQEQKKRKLITEIEKAEYLAQGNGNYESELRNYKMLKATLLKEIRSQIYENETNKNFNDTITSS